MLEGRGEIIAFTDCDLAYGLDIVADFYKASQNCDIVIGSRPLHPEVTPATRRCETDVEVISAACQNRRRFSLVGPERDKIFHRSRGRKKVFGDPDFQTDGFSFDLEALMIAQRRAFGGRCRQR